MNRPITEIPLTNFPLSKIILEIVIAWPRLTKEQQDEIEACFRKVKEGRK